MIPRYENHQFIEEFNIALSFLMEWLYVDNINEIELTHQKI
jgi:hypothetical protein